MSTDERSAAGRADGGRARDVGLGALSVALFSGFALASRAGLTAALAPWDLAAAVPCITTLGAVAVPYESPSSLVLAGVVLVTSGVLVALRRPWA